MHHLNVRHKVHFPIYNKWLDIKASYVGLTIEAEDVTLACSPWEDPKYLLLLLIWASLYDPKCYEVLKPVVTSPMSLENIA